MLLQMMMRTMILTATTSTRRRITTSSSTSSTTLIIAATRRLRTSPYAHMHRMTINVNGTGTDRSRRGIWQCHCRNNHNHNSSHHRLHMSTDTVTPPTATAESMTTKYRRRSTSNNNTTSTASASALLPEDALPSPPQKSEEGTTSLSWAPWHNNNNNNNNNQNNKNNDTTITTTTTTSDSNSNDRTDNSSSSSWEETTNNNNYAAREQRRRSRLQQQYQQQQQQLAIDDPTTLDLNTLIKLQANRFRVREGTTANATPNFNPTGSIRNSNSHRQPQQSLSSSSGTTNINTTNNNRNQRQISKYNTYMNNFYHASYPPPNDGRPSQARNHSAPLLPVAGPAITTNSPTTDTNNNINNDHPVFQTAKQLLQMTIGSFRKHDQNSYSTTATNNNNYFSTQQQSQYSQQSPQQQQQHLPFDRLDHFQMSYNVIQFFLYDQNMCPNGNVRAVNATFAIIERLIREISYTGTHNQNTQYILKNRIQFRGLLNHWKNTAVLGGHVLPAMEMLYKIQWMMTALQHNTQSQPLPIGLDQHSISMILQVMMKQVPKRQAPIVAESVMDVIYEIIDVGEDSDDDDDDNNNNNKKNELQPDGVIYVQILNAWMDSGLPNTAEKMDGVLDDMRIRDVTIDNAIYSILIRYYGQIGSIIKIKECMETMQQRDGIVPNISTLGQAIYGYTKAVQPLQAIQLLDQMYDISTATKTTSATGMISPQDTTTITACTLNILDALKRLIIRSCSTGKKDKETDKISRNVLRAEDIVRKYYASHGSITSSAPVVKSRSEDRVNGALMDIYARSGRVEDVERMMQSIDQRDPVKYSILIRAYGTVDRADLAMDVVFVRMMNDPNVSLPTIHVFKALVEAWIGSSQSDAFERAYSIFQQMDDNELCQQNQLRPDSFMFGALLKVVGASKRDDSGRKVLDILDDMVRRSETATSSSSSSFNKDLIPNPIIYDLALNACFQSSMDIDSAEDVIKRMESSAIPPDLRMYNETLNNYAIIGTILAAERAERMMLHIIELSQRDVTLTPNDFTYNTIINAWVATNDESAPERAWMIYERMRAATVLPNMATFNALINFLSKPVNGHIDVQHADMLLDLMESGTIVGVAPDRRHYGPLMNGWIAIGDNKKAADVLLRRIRTYIRSKGTAKERCLPTPDHFYLVANGWIRMEELVEATEFLERIQTLYDKNHIPEGPDLYSYLTLHSAWARSTHPEAESYIEKIDEIIGKSRKNRNTSA